MRYIIGCGVGALLLCCGCAKDEVFENAKVHKCNLERYVAAAKAAPGDTKLRDDVTQTAQLLEAAITSASDPAALRAKLAASACP